MLIRENSINEEAAETDIWGKKWESESGKRNLQEVSIFERGRRGKEDKENIEGNRDKKCPGETKRSFFSVLGKDREVSAQTSTSTIKNLDPSSNRQQTFLETLFDPT